jgi:hypothetical protein
MQLAFTILSELGPKTILGGTMPTTNDPQILCSVIGAVGRVRQNAMNYHYY